MVTHARLRRLLAAGILTTAAAARSAPEVTTLSLRSVLTDLVRIYRQSRSREIWLGTAAGTLLAWSAFAAALWL